MYEGNLVRLRALRAEDAEQCVQWLNDLDTSYKIRGWAGVPVGLEGERAWIAAHAGPMDGENHFAVETLEGRFIGVCSYNSVDWRARHCMVGWFIGDAEMRGKGCGSDMIKLLLRICFRELGMHRVSLFVFAYNEAVRLYERLGFTREAVLREKAFAMGAYHDEYGYSMLDREYEALYGA